MVEHTLTEREREILTLVVQAYVHDATPVGSRTLARRFGIRLSPATIRNTMNDLEAAGLLEQPHTSAGRVPTDQGYRVYVDQLMEPCDLSPRERQAIRSAVLGEQNADLWDAALILNGTVRALSSITRLLAVSVEPRLVEGHFEKIELVALGDRKVLAVLTIARGFVRTVVIELEASVDREGLEATTRLLNERLSGLPMKAIREGVRERIRDSQGADPKILKLILNNSEEIFSAPSADSQLHLSGMPNILSLPEFADRERMLILTKALEHKEIFLRVLERRSGSGGLTISIGQENETGEISFCSIVSSPYQAGELKGTVGIVGPTRMEYSKLVGLVDYTARLVGEVLGGEESQPPKGTESA
jgi:heat-inducible transcriptional repressor